MILECIQTRLNGRDVLIEFVQCTSLGLGKYSRQTGGFLITHLFLILQENRVVDRRQTLVVQQFRALDNRFAIGRFQFLHGNHRPTCFLNGG